MQDNTVPSSDRDTAEPDFLSRSFMAKDDEVGSEHLRSPVAAAAILLGVYVAMYLAVGAIVHVLTPPDISVHARNATWVELAPDTSASAAGVASSASAQGHGDAHAD